MVFRPRPNHPYAHAARLPDEGEVDLASILPGEGPIEIEIGPGRGGFLFERAAAAPGTRLLGLEIRLKWSAIVDERLGKHGLHPRVRSLNADAREALPRLRPDASVAAFFLHFPDPWWKKRHEKRLVMNPKLLDEITRLLVDGGELYVQTDVEERAELYEAQIGAHPDLEPAGDAPGSARMAENPYGARSPREHRAIEDGLPVTRMRYRRKPRQPIGA
ncbi:tRNA (guanine(46)-N(7))-methyltransferase TrmB [Polyangium aurulentum]|uniref:tRNA (guanine(46)-N(7))-methyltransferase TrmB n=1 Tax=Polyangium aurulentum TaxID=2567896 RepID=UPI0010AE2EF8|nr:tRNA (guanine-N7)-methyltransferase [Polyangium aurulentum]UQA59546.1 tRNA (guanine-N7)-methyltransferase [Polyangium aurulentum]